MLRAPLWDSIPVANYIRLNRGSVLERGKGSHIRCVLFLITKQKFSLRLFFSTLENKVTFLTYTDIFLCKLRAKSKLIDSYQTSGLLVSVFFFFYMLIQRIFKRMFSVILHQHYFSCFPC